MTDKATFWYEANCPECGIDWDIERDVELSKSEEIECIHCKHKFFLTPDDLASLREIGSESDNAGA